MMHGPINIRFYFDVLLTVHLSIFISVINQVDEQNFCLKISLFHASTCFEHMYSSSWGQNCLWYHHTYRCDDTRGWVMQFWPPDDGHMYSKHVLAWNELIVKQKYCASIWLVTEINEPFMSIFCRRLQTESTHTAIFQYTFVVWYVIVKYGRESSVSILCFDLTIWLNVAFLSSPQTEWDSFSVCAAACFGVVLCCLSFIAHKDNPSHLFSQRCLLFLSLQAFN